MGLLTPGSRPEERERTGQELEVSQSTQSSILMVVVTINILVTHLPSEETPPEERNAVLSLPEEPVSSEVVERFSKRKSEHTPLDKPFRRLIGCFKLYRAPRNTPQEGKRDQPRSSSQLVATR